MGFFSRLFGRAKEDVEATPDRPEAGVSGARDAKQSAETANKHAPATPSTKNAGASKSAAATKDTGAAATKGATGTTGAGAGKGVAATKEAGASKVASTSDARASGARTNGRGASEDPLQPASSPFLPRLDASGSEPATSPTAAPQPASSPFLVGALPDAPRPATDAKTKGAPPPLAARPAAPKEAPPPAPPAQDGSGDVSLEGWAAEFEKGFDEMVLDGGAAAAAAPSRQDDFDRASVLELFSQIATTYLRPVRSFMLELNAGEVRREWIDIARPAVKSILEAARQIGVPDLEQGLGDFDAALDQVEETPGASIAGEGRELLIDAYQAMAARLPEVFALDRDIHQRESLIIHSLLLQVPDVRKMTVDKIYRAGLTSLDVLFLATPGDLAATTGIRDELARRIVERFRRYKQELEKSVPDAEQSAARAKLADLVRRLKDEVRRFDEASAARRAEEKRMLRITREGTLLEITVALAELSAYDLVDELERLSFAQRLTELEAFLEKGTS